MMELLRAFLCGGLFCLSTALIPAFRPGGISVNAASIAAVNTVFRLITVIVLTPCVGLLEKFVSRVIPEPAAPEEERTEDLALLEDRFVAYPALALSQCHIVMRNMTRCVTDSVSCSTALLTVFSDERFAEAERLEAQCDLYEDYVSTYLMRVTRNSMTKSESVDITLYLHLLSDFERISDHTMNIAHTARKLSEAGLSFSQTANEELTVLQGAIAEITNLARDLFDSRDASAALSVIALGDIIETLYDDMKQRHIERMQGGVCTIDQSLIFNDLLSNYEGISHRCSKLALLILEVGKNSFKAHSYQLSSSVHQQKAYKSGFRTYAEKYHLP